MLDWVLGPTPDVALDHLSACSHCRDLANALKSSDEVDADAVIAERYTLVRLLGEGATGRVWEGRCLRTGRRVALKVLKAPAHSRRLLREARVVAAIRHESIVELIEVIEDDGAPIIVMELLEGESLAALLARRGRLEIAETLSIALRIAEALEVAHAKGVVHRDLKPEHVFVTNEASQVKVLDFGMAKLVDRTVLEGTTTLTRTGALVGTPCYMAPEQLFADQDVDARADIWALGAILYECLAGKRPVQGEHLGQIFKRIAFDDIVPLASLRPDVPRALDALVTSMLARDRSERPASMAVAIDRLQAVGTRRGHGRRWLVAAALVAVASATVVGLRGANASAARVESHLVPVISLRSPQKTKSAPVVAKPASTALAPAPKKMARRAAAPPSSPPETKPDSAPAPERLPGGVLKASPY